MRDLKFAVRQLLKHPGFTAVAVLTLALGIGLNTSMFSFVNELLLCPLPFPNDSELVRLHRSTSQGQKGSFSPADYLDLKRAEAGFGRFAGYQFSRMGISEQGRPAEFEITMRVSADFFNILGVRPELGRLFRPEEEINGNHRVVIISHALWEERFGGSTNAIGRTVRVNGEAHEVIGIVPRSAHVRRLFGRARIFRPLAFAESERVTRNAQFLNILGRRSHSVSTAQANAFIASFGARIATEFPTENAKSGWRSEGLLESMIDPRIRTLVLMLLGLSGFVLLIACSNLANFLLVRAIARTREFAVRSALGASRQQLIRSLGVESLVLAVLGGVSALVVSSWICDWLKTQTSNHGDFPLALATDWRVLTFAISVSLLAMLFFGIAPALFANRTDLNDTLKSGSRGTTAGRGHQRLQRFLIIGQFAIAMILLTGAGFFVRGAHNELKRHNGWNSDGVVQGTVELPADRYHESAEISAFQRQAIERLEQLVGVKSASLSWGLPYLGLPGSRQYIVEGRESLSKGQEPEAMVNGISRSYFDVTGMRLINGRAFNAADTAASPKVGIINESMARGLFPNDNPVGYRIAEVNSNTPEWIQIVGVVPDVRSLDITQKPVEFQVYLPIEQDEWRQEDGRLYPITLAVRTSGIAPAPVIESIRAAIMAIEPDLPVRDAMTANKMIERETFLTYIIKQLLIGFALLGVSLAALGVYGVIARSVAQRSGEIGIRMALGAQVTDVIRLILGSGVRVALIGAGIGLIGAFSLSRLLASVFPSMQTNGVLVLMAATALLVFIALVACYLPARNASKIDPAIALRAD